MENKAQASSDALSEQKKKYIYVEPSAEHKYTLIFLHGLGDSAKGLEKYFGIKGSPLKISNMRIVLPTAPRCNVTLNKMQMNSWYDILENKSAMDRLARLKEGKFDEVQNDIWNRYNQEDIVKSSDVLLSLIEEEKKLFKDNSASKILIGGMN